MALVPSAMMTLGTPAPDFTLPDTVSGKTLALADIKGEKGTLLLFICNHCPYVKHIERALAQLGSDYSDSGIGIAAISANDAENYPDDAPDKMKQTAHQNGYTFPYLHDAPQDTARAYGAECTPDIFLFDANLKCAYRGQFDSSRPGNGKPVTGEDIRNAMDHLIAGNQVPEENQQPSIGCSIKWK